MWGNGAWGAGGWGSSFSGLASSPATSEVLAPHGWEDLGRQLNRDRAFYALAAITDQNSDTEGQADDLRDFYDSDLDPDPYLFGE